MRILTRFIFNNVAKFLNFIRLGVGGAFSFLKRGGAGGLRMGGNALRNLGIAGGVGVFAGFFDKIKARLGFKPKGVPKGKIPGFGFFNALVAFGYALEGINDFNESKARGNNNFQAFAEAATRVATDFAVYLGAVKAGSFAGAKIGGALGGLIGFFFGGIGAGPGALIGAKAGGIIGGLLSALGISFPDTTEKILGFNPSRITGRLKNFTGGIVNSITGANREKPALESAKEMNKERNKKRGSSFNKDEGFSFGGIIKAPETGAFVKLHGLEEIRPLDADGSMKNERIASLIFDDNIANIIDLTSQDEEKNNEIATTPSSNINAVAVPSIPSSDYANNYPLHAQHFFNVVSV